MSAAASVLSASSGQTEWLQRVLGITLSVDTASGSSTSTVFAEFQAAADDWVQALGAVDKQMAGLKAALLASGDVEYEDIADDCLDGVIGPGPRAMAAVFQKIGAAPGQFGQAATATLPALAKLFATLNANAAIAVCETNPVRAPVAIRATLLPRLTRLQDVLRHASAV